MYHNRSTITSTEKLNVITDAYTPDKLSPICLANTCVSMPLWAQEFHVTSEVTGSAKYSIWVR